MQRITRVALWSVVALAVFLLYVTLACYHKGSRAIQLTPLRELPTPELTTLDFPHTNGNCRGGGYKSWDKGAVTTLSPRVTKNCSRLFVGNITEAEQTRSAVDRWNSEEKKAGRWSDRTLLQRVKNCSWLEEELSNNLYVTEKERNFPLAFIFVVYENAWQVFRLLKLLYRSHNAYCIHYDRDSEELFQSVFSNIASCMDNIIIPSQLECVHWGDYTILEAQLHCLDDLVKYRDTVKWKYVINLCGKEIPLKTNTEIVTLLDSLNGTSPNAVSKLTENQSRRVKYKYVRNKETGWRVRRTTTRLGPIPYHLTVYKSSSYNTLSYSFSNFILYSNVSIALRSFLHDCKSPEEEFYGTLLKFPGAPGGMSPNLTSTGLAIHTETTRWLPYNNSPWDHLCHGLNVHNICILSASDLPLVVKPAQRHMRVLFYNKYFMEYDHTVMDCMEEILVQRNVREYQEECNGNP